MGGNDHEDSEDSLEKRIFGAYDIFSPAELRLADALIKCHGDLARYSATELALEASVSKATTARFFQKLGYTDFRHARRQALQSRPWGSPLEALAELTEPLQGRGNLGRHVANDIHNLTQTAEEIPPQDLARATGILANARRILVVGFRNSHSLASYAFMVLNSIKPDVRLLGPNVLSSPEQIVGLGKDDAILAVGFRRRPHALPQLLETAGVRGATSVLIADSTARKTADLATVTLTCKNQGANLFDSYVSGLTILNFLCSSVALNIGDPAWARLSEIEDLHDAFGDLIQPEKSEPC